MAHNGAMHGHDHAHDHGHDHGHGHAQASGGGTRRALVIALVLTGGFAVVEAIGGWMAGSLALLSDAGHMITDAAALGLALFADAVARRPASSRASPGASARSLYAEVVGVGGGVAGFEVLVAAKGFGPVFYDEFQRL